MSKYRLGDHVRVIVPGSPFWDATGTISDLTEGSYPYKVQLQPPSIPIAFKETELVLADGERE